jgi:type II secretory pathway pseudopilin PulG
MLDKKKYCLPKTRRGFTLIELLVFIAIFTLIIGAFIAILVSTVNVQTKQVAVSEVEQQGQFLTQQLQYYVQGARLIDMAPDSPTSTLVLRESSSSLDPTTISLSSGTIYLQQGSSGALQPLTSSKINISNLSFTRHYNLNSTSSSTGADSLSYSFNVSTGNSTSSQSAEVFQSSIEVLAPVNKIVLLQQAKKEINATDVGSIAVAYPNNNKAGDLLVAVLGEQGIASTSIADTNGNLWKLIASTTYPANNDRIYVFATNNAIAGANTSTISFGGTFPNYPSLFIYEYRGASISGSFDSEGAQFSLSSSAASSGIIYPMGGAELVLGINDNATTNEVPSPAPGFTLETSSTVNYTTELFVEDEDQFITGGVSANWQYSGTPGSATMILTFR